MKQFLIATTSLVVVSVATGAQASEKIKLELGGYSKWWVVGAWQKDSYQAATNRDFNSVDIKGDNEIFIGGSTTLDNGLNVGIIVELEAGGNFDTTAAVAGGTDVIDKSSVFVSGGFGKVIVGSESNSAALLHVMAPDAAGNTDTDGLLTGGWAIQDPGLGLGQSIGIRTTTAINTDGSAEKITYVSPTFHGLTAAASYAPSSSEDNRGVTDVNAQVISETYGVGALYANTFGGFGVTVSAGWMTYDVEDPFGTGTPIAGETSVNEYSTGAQLSYAGFTLGGSYRKINGDTAIDAIDSTVWDAGIQYASGPYAVSFVYFESKMEDLTNVAADDKLTVYQVSGKYSMGPGVDVLATVGHAKYEGETNAVTASNEGWSVMTGLSLAF